MLNVAVAFEGMRVPSSSNVAMTSLLIRLLMESKIIMEQTRKMQVLIEKWLILKCEFFYKYILSATRLDNAATLSRLKLPKVRRGKRIRKTNEIIK